MKCVENEEGSREVIERLHDEIKKQREEIERLKARNSMLEFEERRISRITGIKCIDNMNSPLSVDKSWQGTQKLVTSAHSLPLNVDLSRRPDDPMNLDETAIPVPPAIHNENEETNSSRSLSINRSLQKS